jgi:hypothetical protein
LSQNHFRKVGSATSKRFFAHQHFLTIRVQVTVIRSAGIWLKAGKTRLMTCSFPSCCGRIAFVTAFCLFSAAALISLNYVILGFD